VRQETLLGELNVHPELLAVRRLVQAAQDEGRDVVEAFEFFDADRNGDVSPDEFQKVLTD
jgi:Ca2+-binding EF-hand superfamily protein